MHGFDEGDGVFCRCLLDDTVAEIEDVAGTVCSLSEYFLGSEANFGLVREQHERI